MTRLDQRQRGPVTPTDALREATQGAIDALRRWVGDTVPEVDTGERAPMRQRVPA